MSPPRLIDPSSELAFSRARVRLPDRALRQLSGFSIERVRLPDEEFEYRLLGDNHFLALHDIKLQDGEIQLADQTRSQARSLIDRLTFVPSGCQVTGWSKPKKRNNSYTALFFDAPALVEEFRDSFAARATPPFLYLYNASLKTTLEKLTCAVTAARGSAYIESLCLVAVGELLQIRATGSGQKLSEHQLDRLLEFVEAHLASDISVEDMAKVLGLSRFHFSRVFKATTSQSPYQFLLDRRIQRSKLLLRSSSLSVADIAMECGFRGVPQFQEAFRRIVGTGPIGFRAESG